MRILLVLPAAESVRVTRGGGSAPRREMLRFSVLPLTTVAALTPAEHEVVLGDENVEALDFAADVDLVGLSFMTAVAPRAYEIAAAFRERGIPVVAGGYHPTFCPEEVALHVDAVVVGEAEGQWPRLLADLEAGRLQRIYRTNTPCDPALIPTPRRDLTARTAHHYVTTNGIQTGRGCRHGCRYCSITAFHRQTHRSRPLDRVLEEVRAVPRDFIFLDDNIIADPSYARALFAQMAPLGKRWVSQCSISIADDRELLSLARRAGCVGLFIGVETLDDLNLADFGKLFNEAPSYQRRIAAIRGEGIGVVAGMIVGADHDDPTVFRRTLAFLQRVEVDGLQLNILTPLPGTPLFSELESEGRIVDRDLSHYDFRHTVIRPSRMTGAELQAGADWLYCQFYRLDRIALRASRAAIRLGWRQAWLIWRLNTTYRADNRRDRLKGRDPAAKPFRQRLWAALARWAVAHWGAVASPGAEASRGSGPV
jgi:radical SAM superfamily enzyme YgiQ (UPF0313 family)